MNFLLERPIPEVILEVIFWGRIPPEQLTRLQSSAIILGYKGRQDQVDTPEFKKAILTKKLNKNKIKPKFFFYSFFKLFTGFYIYDIIIDKY